MPWVCCVALPCCLFDLACFFLPSLIKTCIIRLEYLSNVNNLQFCWKLLSNKIVYEWVICKLAIIIN